MLDILHAPLSDGQSCTLYSRAQAPSVTSNISPTDSVWCHQAQKDLGFLMNPGEGPVTAVELYTPPDAAIATHLFSGGADGTFAVWSAGPTWDCLKVNLALYLTRQAA